METNEIVKYVWLILITIGLVFIYINQAPDLTNNVNSLEEFQTKQIAQNQLQLEFNIATNDFVQAQVLVNQLQDDFNFLVLDFMKQQQKLNAATMEVFEAQNTLNNVLLYN